MSKKDSAVGDLTSEASLALSGAEYVREKLGALVSMGPQSLYDQVYAIKLRTKSLSSLTKKVVSKRTIGKKPSYRADDATDIVGMRLLSLYASDLPKVTRSFLSFLRFCQSPQISLVHGETLDDGIKEVIVYKSSQVDASRIYEKIHRYFRSQPISELNKDGSKKIDIVDFDPEIRSYSSVHIVVHAVSHSGGSPKIIPIEVQIRSVFEDTWGEIDHGLEYKIQELTNGIIPEDYKPFYENTRKSLRKLKDKLEDIGSDAEIIRDGYNNVFDRIPLDPPSAVTHSFELSPVHIGNDYETHINLKRTSAIQQDFAKRFDEIICRVTELRRKMEMKIVSQKSGDELVVELMDLADFLEEQDDQFKSAKPFGRTNYQKIRYFLRMEIAICNVWSFLISDHFNPTAIEHNLSYLDKSISIYFEIENSKPFRNDTFVNFRLGCALILKNKLEIAELFLWKSCEFLSNDKRLENSMFDVIVPHKMSFAIWLKRASLLELGFRANNPRINREDQIEIIQEALCWSLHAKNTLEKYKNCENNHMQKLKYDVSNNIVCFIWELLDFSPSKEEFVLVVSESIDLIEEQTNSKINLDFEWCLEAIQPEIFSTEDDITTLDTKMKANQLRGDVDKTEELTKIIDTIVDKDLPSARMNLAKEIYIYSLAQVKRKGAQYEVAKDLDRIQMLRPKSQVS